MFASPPGDRRLGTAFLVVTAALVVSMAWLLALPRRAPAAEPSRILIPLDERVPNRYVQGSPGTCWWACAEMVGRHHRVQPLLGLVDRVILTGRGLNGAGEAEIGAWAKELGLKVTSIGRDSQRLANALHAGQPVIATVYQAATLQQDYTHAVLVTGLSAEPRAWVDGAGVTHHDHVVSYIDPNEIGVNVEQAWQVWSATWLQAHLIEPPSASGTNEVTASGTLKPSTPGQGVTSEPSDNRPRLVVPLPERPPAPSNQDLKDGVTRPADKLENSLYEGFRHSGHDYYREFKERKPSAPGEPVRPSGPRSG